MFNKLDKKSIANILSIRYDPNDKINMDRLEWKSFKTSTSDLQGKKTEKYLKESIKKKIGRYVGPISISLSGGIDSSLALALLRNVYPTRKLIAICGIFEGHFDESPIARKIAKKFGAEFHTVKMDSIFTTMPKIISISKKPRWNTYQHLIAKEAKNHSKILVTGDGADELFGGYVFRYNKFLNLLRPNNNWKIKTINYLECHNRDWVPDQESIFGNKIKFDWNKIYAHFKPYFTNSLNSVSQVMLADYNGKLLYDFIPTTKSISDYYNLKINSIFLDSELIEFATSLPLSQKYSKSTMRGKLVLRNIAKRHNVEHIDEKRGFSPGLFFDWKKKGRKICEKYLLDEQSNVYSNRIINYNWVISAFETVDNDGDIRYLNRLISILAVEIWYRLFITKEISDSKRLN